MSHRVYGFIGLGLIGGSIARALKAAEPDSEIIAYDPDKISMSQAYEEGVVDVLTSEIGPRFSDCEIVFLCAPVAYNIANAEKVRPYLGKNAILTDVSSVKSEIHSKIHSLGLDRVFVGGHPMAGSERVGYANSKAKLLENAYYIITETESNTKTQIDTFKELVAKMGAIPLIMSPNQHDFITAAVSHVPHVISASLVNLVRENDTPDEKMKMIAAGGFKDITRISSSSPVMWQQICLSNADNISALLQKYIQIVSQLKNAIDSHDPEQLLRAFDSARRYRDTFIDTSSGPIKTSNSIHVEIADEPGALAIVATILASHSINIKNVGIVHNREFETGSLRIELHDENDVKKAAEILEKHGFASTVG